MMDTPESMPYDSRGAAPAHMPPPVPPLYIVAPDYSAGPMAMAAPHYQYQPVFAYMSPPVAPQYVVAHTYSAGPLTMAAPHYQNQPAFAYVPYPSPPPATPIRSQYRQDFQECQSQLMAGPDDDDAARATSLGWDSKQLNGIPLQGPSAKSESQASMAHSSISKSTAHLKTITYNETIDPADRVNFDTDVDQLVKVIQRKDDKDGSPSQALMPVQTPRVEPKSEHQWPTTLPMKKWACDGPKCNKRFTNKGHLEIHRRTHTGQKPYVCTWEDCGVSFTQEGNLKTHMRRHAGEKPYPCSICRMRFAQRGNRRVHEESHKGLKPFVCRLDQCNKAFSLLGNMKSHQNSSHKDTLRRLTAMFIRSAQGGAIPDEYQELFKYLQAHYKNSNKGIKGRGKARRIAPNSKRDGQSALAFPHGLPQPAAG